MALTELGQRKMVAPGRVHSWRLDLQAMEACAPWARAHPGLLGQEVAELLRAFPTMVAALGRVLPERQCWVEAAEPLRCPACGDLLVFERGIRCVCCGEAASAGSDDLVVGLVGRIPALLSGRPLDSALARRVAELRERGDARLGPFEEALLQVGGRRFLAPRFGLWFSRHTPHADPPVMVWPEYFEMLDIPADHVYLAPPYFRLCLYASWREQPARAVLQGRVVPRLHIDLMVADLRALGRLGEALSRLGIDLYALYNAVGRPDRTGPLQAVYAELVRR